MFVDIYALTLKRHSF